MPEELGGSVRRSVSPGKIQHSFEENLAPAPLLPGIADMVSEMRPGLRRLWIRGVLAQAPEGQPA